jgi:uncharacterized protein YgiB involved in biofilm formation
MKRSTQLSLVLMSASALTLSACEGQKDEEVALFRNANDCMAAGLSREACTWNSETAKRVHEADAPRFQSKEDCEKEFGPGRCEVGRRPDGAQASTGGGTSGGASASSFWIPAAAGFMVARALADRPASPAQPVYNCPPERQRPDGTCYTTSRGTHFYGTFWRTGGASTARVPTSLNSRPTGGAVVVSRGSSLSRAISSSSSRSATSSGTTSRGGFGAIGRAFSSSS